MPPLKSILLTPSLPRSPIDPLANPNPLSNEIKRPYRSSPTIPQTSFPLYILVLNFEQLTLLLQKSLLLLFGDTTTTLPQVKSYVRKTLKLPPLDKSKSVITTNPLDYHLFCQEIISKYPTYTPPPLPVRESLISEPTQTIALPPQEGNTTYYEGSKGPVHIATPAPSPPPSPKLKKSIFQTDGTVPLLLPGMKGEVPAAIMEAGALFAERMRVSAATAQMWDEKDKFQGYVKGFWDYELEDEFVVEAGGAAAVDDKAGAILQRIEDTYVCPLNRSPDYFLSPSWSLSSRCGLTVGHRKSLCRIYKGWSLPSSNSSSQTSHQAPCPPSKT